MRFIFQTGTKTDDYFNLFAFGWTILFNDKIWSYKTILEIRVSIIGLNFILDITLKDHNA